MTSPKIPKELEGKAYLSQRGKLRYLECIDCGEPKDYGNQHRAKCKSCKAKHREQTDKWNPTETTRICRVCEEEKELTLENFYQYKSKGTFYTYCKPCYLEHTKEKRRAYNNRPEVIETRNEKLKQKRLDPSTKLRHNVSTAVREALQASGNSKRGASILSHLPYTIAELKAHLERQFEAGMSWENWGVGEGKWNIDHIYPQSKLRFDSMEHPNFQKCWALSNLRPMWSLENIAKKDKIVCEDLKKNDKTA